MAYSLGLTLYNLAHRAAPGPSAPRPERPAGRLVWLHAPSSDAVRPMAALARRLADDDGFVVLLTLPDPQPALKGPILQPPPPDTPAEARAFLDHWRPEAAILAEGELRPALLHEAAERGIPMALVDARAPHLPKGRDGWWPGLTRAILSGFRAVLAVDEPAARAFRRAGAPPGAVTAPGRMEQPSAALPCTEAERAALARLIATRPVWFAAHLPEAEETPVIEAHRSVLRLAHRMLLILAPADPARAAALAERMEAREGWTVARRSTEEEPDPDVQVYLVDVPGENGLWYRLAPMTYLGGSLSAEGCLVDPLEPAALGSAVLHGPRSGAFGATVGRLASAQAAVLVGSAADLADSLGELLAPDRVARLAQAAWAVTSDGADVTDRVVRLVREMTGGPG
ncbi:MAG TPA: glycosyltransferase N-terminal domain-containing protein [Paracoccaceae bacterium]|nr:glycosyltransferase N-terminal domain-containing protein [Paracoccaceae bacterium]